MTTDGDIIETDLLIVGAGPAGASLACFLASHGRTGVMIAAAPGTAHTPRAHITNMAGLECLRDIGLEQSCLDLATQNENMAHTRWCHTMAGEEYARIYSWGNDPMRKGHYEAASPCNHVDLPQTLLEPILTRRAVSGGWKLRFDTSFVSCARPSPDLIISTVHDSVSNRTYKIRSRFLFGCDGARSQVVRELGIPLVKKPGQGLALNVLIRADLSHVMGNRTGNLHWAFLPEKEYPAWGWAAVVRMVRPWTEWMFIFLPHPASGITAEDMDAPQEEYIRRVKEMIGDERVEPEILDVSKWQINETVAERYDDGGNVFCLGDAVHRHPPFNGLGSNTCIQDAFNLAWKVSLVMSGRAGPSLLSTFSPERQPVGETVITRANQGLRDHSGWMETIGMLELDVERRKEILAEFEDEGPKGRARRAEFRRNIATTGSEFHGLGVEMNQRYDSGGVYLDDEGPPAPPPEDPVKEYQISTYPGKRLPHCWLNSRSPGNRFSTIDLAGHGRFTLLTGPGGQAWKDAAKKVSGIIGVEVKAYSIGWKQDCEDVYFDWAGRSEVEEDGCVLVRPDRFVAWRSKGMIEDCAGKLEAVLRRVLFLDELDGAAAGAANGTSVVVPVAA
ncbi:related to phenol 2-monooxygenase [Cephalotrichum gorgonifer]|uniref:Related to phenol 2-monooxygenase n=1 Tax=Cephalotrichum gorgonifer TaxID=2041049 RepID=A0AAE8SXY6_9PEZI|nr:related to phenol 2-monooxygenase [Cephalotrichum gorgonifer]